MDLGQMVRDAAEPLAAAMSVVDQVVGVDATKEVLVKYRHDGVEVKILKRAVGVAMARRHQDLWAMFIDEFVKHGWGFHSRFLDGVDRPRTSMVFDHPITLTRVR